MWDVFYSLCRMIRSSVVDGLITRLDFHPPSIDLLASAANGNDWEDDWSGCAENI